MDDSSGTVVPPYDFRHSVPRAAVGADPRSEEDRLRSVRGAALAQVTLKRKKLNELLSGAASHDNVSQGLDALPNKHS